MRRWMEGAPTIAAFAASAVLFNQLPPAGTVDFTPLFPPGIPVSGGPVSRIAAALLLPTVSLAAWILLTALSKVRGPVTPLPQWWLNEQTGSAAITKFEPTFNTIVFSVTALMALVHIVFLGSLLGWPEWSYRAATIVFGIGMMAAGNVMPRVRPNWMFGLRTKRTLSDPVAWSKTHRAWGMFLMISGILVVLASIVAPRYALLIGFVGLILTLPAAYVLGTTSAIQSGGAS